MKDRKYRLIGRHTDRCSQPNVQPERPMEVETSEHTVKTTTLHAHRREISPLNQLQPKPVRAQLANRTYSPKVNVHLYSNTKISLRSHYSHIEIASKAFGQWSM